MKAFISLLKPHRAVFVVAVAILTLSSFFNAALTAMIEPLTDDEDVKSGLLDLVTAIYG